MFRRLINKITFSLLSFFLLLFYGLIFFETFNTFLIIIFFLGLAFLLIGLTVEKTKLKYEYYTIVREIEVIFSIFLSAIATFLLSTNGLGPVVAAAMVGLFYSVSAPYFKGKKLSHPVYCGAFVGMSTSNVFPELWMVGLAGLLSGIIFIASHEVYNETGGTLGTIAFAGVTAKKAILSLLFG